MKAVLLQGIEDLAVRDIPAPAAQPGRYPVDIAAIGICGSDLHYYLEGGIAGARVSGDGFTPGHELAGYLAADVPERGLQAGQRVAIDPQRPCGRCELCRHGQINLCPHVEFMGAPPISGGMIETAYVAPEQLHPVPDSLSDSDVALLEPAGVAIHAMDLAEPRFQEDVAVLGCGPIGLLLVQTALIAGARRVYAVDPVRYRREIAARLGAHGIAASYEALTDLTAGRGCDLVLEATNAPSGLAEACESAKIGGRLVIVGIPDGGHYALSAGPARRKGLTVKFSRRAGHVYPRAIALAADGRLDLATIATHHLPFESAGQGFALQAQRRDGAIKSVLFGPNYSPQGQKEDRPKSG